MARKVSSRSLTQPHLAIMLHAPFCVVFIVYFRRDLITVLTAIHNCSRKAATDHFISFSPYSQFQLFHIFYFYLLYLSSGVIYFFILVGSVRMYYLPAGSSEWVSSRPTLCLLVEGGARCLHTLCLPVA